MSPGYLVSVVAISVALQGSLQGSSQSCLRDPHIYQYLQCPRGYAPYPSCNQCMDSRLDPLSSCKRCKPGEQHCHVGNYTLSIVFHSYGNPNHLCAECRVDTFGPSCCDYILSNTNCSFLCGLRMIVSVEAFMSLPLYIPLNKEAVDVIFSDEINYFPETLELLPGVSNPFITSLSTWTERFQLYIVTFDIFNAGQRRAAAVDRFLINVHLGAPPAYRKRQTYTGIYNISHFDISFNIKCSENFYGEDCKTFCIPTLGVYYCDKMGQKVCIDKSCDPATNCYMCTSVMSAQLSLGSGSSPFLTSTTSQMNGEGNIIAWIGVSLGGALLILLVVGCCLCLFLFRMIYKIWRETMEQGAERIEVSMMLRKRSATMNEYTV